MIIFRSAGELGIAPRREIFAEIFGMIEGMRGTAYENADCLEGIEAFKDKRAPNFSDRCPGCDEPRAIDDRLGKSVTRR